jgi:hypothetical protein
MDFTEALDKAGSEFKEQMHRMRSIKKVAEPRKCLICHEEFTPTNTKCTNQKYCADHSRSKQLQLINQTPYESAPTNFKGTLSELIVAADLMKKGYHVFRNLAPHGLDLIAYGQNKEMLRIEVTTGRYYPDGNILFERHEKSSFNWDYVGVGMPDGAVFYTKDGGQSFLELNGFGKQEQVEEWLP